MLGSYSGVQWERGRHENRRYAAPGTAQDTPGPLTIGAYFSIQFTVSSNEMQRLSVSRSFSAVRAALARGGAPAAVGRTLAAACGGAVGAAGRGAPLPAAAAGGLVSKLGAAGLARACPSVSALDLFLPVPDDDL